MARQLGGFREHDLTNVDIPRQESSLAICEVVFPHAPEPVVESRRRQFRPGLAEIASPYRKRLGIILSKDALADDRHAKALAELLEHLRRGQHATGEDI